MRGNFTECFQHVLGHEGGFQSDPRDKGNWTGGKVGAGENKGTKWGVSAAAYPNLDIRGLTKAQAQSIYARDYWGPIEGDLLPMGVDLCVFDAAINSGVSRAAEWLQEVIGAPVDGDIGNETVTYLLSKNPRQVINDYCDRRLEFLRGLPTWETYGKGWGNRVKAIRTTSTLMTAIAPDVFPEDKPVEPEKYEFTEEELVTMIAAIVREILKTRERK